MVAHGILPQIGAPVSLPGLDLAAVEQWSVGQWAYLATYATKKFAAQLADPTVAHEFATFATAQGADWSGYQPVQNQPVTEEQQEEPVVPSPPENYHDSLPAIAQMVRQQRHAQEAIVTHFAKHLEPAFPEQSTHLGTPIGVKAFKDVSTYLREVLGLSRQTVKKIQLRLPYVTWKPGADPELEASQPKLGKIAASFADSKISGENLDRLIGLDQDLTKYVQKVGGDSEYKDHILQAFEPTLLEAAESSTPDELSQAKTRWANTIAHHLDADGPPVAEALRKQADNAIRTQNYADGSGKIWIHASPHVYAGFKNFALHQLNLNGTPIAIDPELIDLLSTENEDQQPDSKTTFDDIDEQPLARDEAEVAAEDSNGRPFTHEEIAQMDKLSTGQRLGAILIGMFQTLLTMDSEEANIKKAHGHAAQLTIIQDLETAYETLGIGALPEKLRRPRGPAGMQPTIISRPNPDDPDTFTCHNPEHTQGSNSPPWTGFLSEILNIGPVHPKETKLLACDSKIVGQIWNGRHAVLNQHRAHRTFTPTQRQAILARDRGCQAPGCTMPAIYCQIHHIKPWLLGGNTDIDNSVTLCAIHHAAVHNGKWKIRTHHGVTFFQPAPWLDPGQPLLRNLYWAA